MQRPEKERTVEELAERLRSAQAILVADYRGLAMTELDRIRGEMLENGARLSVVKNTLTRRAAEAAGAEGLLELLVGPSAIAFIESEGDPVAVARVMSEAARTTNVLVIKGGLLEGKRIDEADVRSLATLPPLDVLRGQVLAAILAPLTALVSLVSAPLRDFVGLLDARAEQLNQASAEPPAAVTAEPSEEAVEAAEPEPNDETKEE
ncbi:MAG: 50S ribosomal protein L10 [Actinomycetota bacterium]|nr:50S ribosomal protein L10 [Actinomycetota bacterium]